MSSINIQPYLDKLELLKEYMFLKIDGRWDVSEFNYGALPVLHSSEILRIFNETGNLMYTPNFNPQVKVLSFEEFLQKKQATGFMNSIELQLIKK